MKKLAIITTHPIQYNAPLFKLLTERNIIDVKVFYTWGESVLKEKFDPGFGKVINWDIPLLEGYDYTMVQNISTHPGSHHFKGIINPTLINDIESWGADAVLVFGWSFVSHLKCIRYFHKKIPVYFRGDSTMLNESKSGLKYFIKKIFLNWVYNFVDTAFYVGSANKDYYLACKVKESSLVFAPHAIDNKRFEKESSSNNRIEWGISPTDFVFLYAGKFEKVKNISLLLRAFSQLNSDNAYLLLVGNGPLESEIDSMIKQFDLKIQNRIKIVGFVNQNSMPAIYNAADVYVLPSFSETWGLSVNEAMASSLPVIVSDRCGCCKDLVIESVTGYVFNSNHLASLTSCMQKIIVNNNLTKRMGENAHQHIQGWSFNNIANAIENQSVLIN